MLISGSATIVPSSTRSSRPTLNLFGPASPPSSLSALRFRFPLSTAGSRSTFPAIGPSEGLNFNLLGLVHLLTGGDEDGENTAPSLFPPTVSDESHDPRVPDDDLVVETEEK